MLGLKNFVYRKHGEILENFFSLARGGETLPGDTPGHLDGWGIGYYKNGEAVVHRSGGSIVEEKQEFFKTCEEVGKSETILLHLRKSAWSGTSAAAHAHPFLHKNILFAHNGTIKDYKKLREEIPGPHLPGPEALDTEVYFHYLMAFASSGLEEAFHKAVRHIRARHKYSSLTSLFTDGKRLYGYREYAKYSWYYTLYYAWWEDAEIVASQPVSPDLSWKSLPKGKLLVF